MINLLFGLAAALGVVLLLFVLKISVWLAMPLGLLAGLGLFIFLSKRIQKDLEELFRRAGELMKKQQFDGAIEILREGYRLAPRQFLIRGTLDGQIGIIQYLRKKNDEAEPLLRSAGVQVYMAKAMLGVLLWKRGEKAQAKQVFSTALKAGKKDSLVYAVYAYVLNEMKERDAAVAILNRGLESCKGDERLLTNRNLLQNNKAMKMKVYGEQWYQFLLERPVLRQEAPPFARLSKRAMRG